jgi:type IV pilus assembly protein PilV
VLVKPRGVSLIEVLVALAIAAFGLLGTLALQARALSAQKDAFQRRSAAELVAQFAERMRANHLAVLSGHYVFDFDVGDPAPASAAACSAPCSSVEVALRDLDEWRIELRRRLPLSAAYVRWSASEGSGVDVAVAWPEVATPNADTACEALGLGARIPAGYRCYRAVVLP